MEYFKKLKCCNIIRSICGVFLLINYSVSAAGKPPHLKQNIRGNGLMFTQNLGQIADSKGSLRRDVLYKGQGGGADIYLRNTGITYVFTNMAQIIHDVNSGTEVQEMRGGLKEEDEKKKRKKLLKEAMVKIHRIDMDFIGCNNNIEKLNEDEVEGYSNYYLAHCPNGVTNVKSYNKISFSNVYQGIDAIYYGNQSTGIKYNIIVNPRADPSQIKLQWSGAEDIHINNEGLLVIKTSINTFFESIPKIYQNINGQTIDIKAKYVLNGSTVSFTIGHWNSEFPLIIDPWVTYFGGSNSDEANDISTDVNGNVIITGGTSSIDFPISVGAFQSALDGAGDIFISKLDSSGKLIWSTYFGGSSEEGGIGIATDYNSNILVTGSTNSHDFPVASAYQGTFSGGFDAFILKLNKNGNRLWATYYGGSSYEQGNSITVDKNGKTTITGYTASPDFPVSLGAFQTIFGSVQNAFVVKFDSTGNRVWSTFYGGNSWDQGNAITTDNSNNIIISGTTQSANFPISIGAFQSNFKGMEDAFIVKFDSTGSRLWATFYGGTNKDEGNGIATDEFENVIIIGSTWSSDLPITSGSIKTIFGGIGASGFGDAFISKFNPSGNRLWSTYFGGSDGEEGFKATSDSVGNIFISGDTYSTDLPVTSCAYQPLIGGAEDLWFAKLNPAGDKIYYSSYLGGNSPDDDEIGRLALFKDKVFIEGRTAGNFPVTPGAFQIAIGGLGATNAAIAGITISNHSFPNFYSNTISTCVGLGTVSFINNSVLGCATIPASSVSYLWYFSGGTPSTSNIVNPTGIIYNSPGVYDVKLVISTAGIVDSIVRKGYIKILPLPKINILSTPILCNGEMGALIAIATGGTSPYTFNWNTGASSVTSSDTSRISNIMSGNYFVVIKDSNGCGDTGKFSLTQPALLNLTQTFSNLQCNGNNTGIATANVTGGTIPYTYSWSSGATSKTISNLFANSYTVTVVDVNGCQSTMSVNITEPPLLSGPNIKIINSLCGQSDGVAIATATGGTGILSYTWSNGDAGSTANNLASGNYSVTVIDANGCLKSASDTVFNIGGPKVSSSITSEISCYGQNNGIALVNAKGGTGSLTYNWSNGGNDSTINNLSAGAYSVTVTDANGCSASSNVALMQPGNLVPLATQQSSATCGVSNGVATVSATGGTGNYFFTWSNSATGITNIVLAGGSYTVTVSDNNGCIGTTTGIITNSNGPTANVLNSANTCQGKAEGSINVQSTGVGDIYTWSNGATTQNISNLSSGSYSITVTDANGCIAITSSTVGVFPLPIINAGTDKSINIGQSIQLIVSGGISFLWTPSGSLNNALIYNPIASPNQTTTYTVLVTDSNNCSATDSVRITVVEFFIPTAFSPNNDGENDVFYIRGTASITSMNLLIYNRWGELVFSSTEPTAGWNGAYKGKQLDAGVFAYYFTGTFVNGTSITRKGNVTLVR